MTGTESIIRERGTMAISDYSDYKILVDTPNPVPVLGYENYAKCLTDIIVHSHPQFAKLCWWIIKILSASISAPGGTRRKRI
jgi:hypothetical protein